MKLPSKEQFVWTPRVEMGVWASSLVLFFIAGLISGIALMFWMMIAPAFALGRLVWLEKRSESNADEQ